MLGTGQTLGGLQLGSTSQAGGLKLGLGLGQTSLGQTTGEGDGQEEVISTLVDFSGTWILL